jgi:RNA polymerase sigma factor (sigma-70 family)
MASAGDRGSWDVLVARYARVVWAVARSFGLDAGDAADVSQTTWLRLVENLDKVREPAKVGAWLATTARREALRILRLSARSVPTSDGEFLDAHSDADVGLEHAAFLTEDRDQVVSALLMQLSPRQQMVLRLLHGPDQLSYQELSEVLEIPIGSIGPTRARALGQLRRLCQQAGITEY